MRDENTGIILVLIPAGTFWMGSQNEDPHGRNFDPGRNPEEELREVTIEAPFFLSKFEMTQGQWQRSPAANRNPSTYSSGKSYPGHLGSVTLLNPVESVTWTTCTKVMRRIGLRLPDEERWEYAARAGSTSIWVGDTDSVGGIPDWGNIAGAESIGRLATARSSFRDDYVVHAPGGKFLANDFGLFDVLGNVWEWTSTDLGEPAGCINRGGSFFATPAYCRLATRMTIPRDQHNGHLGLRPMCEVR